MAKKAKASEKAANLKSEASKVIQQGALVAVHHALSLARKTVRAADHALQEKLPRAKRKTTKTAKTAAATVRRGQAKGRRGKSRRARKSS